MIDNKYTLDNLTDYSVWLLDFNESGIVPGDTAQTYAQSVNQFVSRPGIG